MDNYEEIEEIAAAEMESDESFEVNEENEEPADISLSNEEPETSLKKRKGRKAKVKYTDKYPCYEHNDILDFISKIEKNSVIWDPSSKCWHRNDLKKNIYKQIEAELSRFMPKWPRYPGRVAENLWKDLSRDYSAHMMRICKAKSGSGSNDVNSNFKFSEHLTFLNGPRQMRLTKNAFVIGSPAHQKMETAVTPKRSATEKLLGGAPKKVKINPDSPALIMQKEMEKTRELFAEVFGKRKNLTECGSERVCKVYKELVANMDEMDRYEMEGRVITFMCDLRRQNARSSSTSNLNSPALFSTRNSSGVPANFEDLNSEYISSRSLYDVSDYTIE